MASVTRRILRGGCPTFLATARVCIVLSSPRLAHRGRALGATARMSAEVARRRELAQLVPDHVLADVDGDVLLAVMHANRQPDHQLQDGGRARPRLDHTLVAATRHARRLLEQRW